MDDIDHKILRVLQEAPDISMENLGEKIGLSHTPCWRRIKRMETAGIIRQHTVIIDREALGFEVVVFAFIRLARHDEETLNGFETAVKGCREIVDCYSITGDYDYSLKILASNVKGYERLVKDVILHLPGVGSISSSFALSEVKHTSALPI
jgi:Lrp/AsnC family transcriptional regulator, cysteine-sensing transcriptional activator